MGNIFKLAIIIAILIILMQYHRYSAFNTTAVKVCDSGKCSSYNIHIAHANQQSAAKLMDEIVARNDKLLEHLRAKYKNTFAGMNPDKADRIDVIKAEPMDSKYLIAERVNQLFDKYDSKQIYEISPLNHAGSTSYTENKKILVLCLREKLPNARGEYDLHHINDMMFVVLHELSHMMNDQWGHKREFWALFKIMLQEGVEAGVYEPVDYTLHPINYCGLDLAYNPLYDSGL